MDVDESIPQMLREKVSMQHLQCALVDAMVANKMSQQHLDLLPTIGKFYELIKNYMNVEN